VKRGWGGVFLGVLDTVRAAEEARFKKLQDRFWVKVDIVRDDECWEWKCPPTGGGYGQFTIEGKVFKAHRVAYELTIGPIPNGLVLDHLCRNRICVNPHHMEPVTQRENIMRGDLEVSVEAIRRHWRSRTHCKWGHELTPENVYVPPKLPTARACRTCRGRRSREAQQRAKETAA
jgi:hypothetical protein